MQRHEHFEELCALVPIGQLTAEEYRELSEHLKACSSCQHATEDFSLILDRLPVGDVDVDDQVLLTLQGNSYRERFLRRARAEGVPFSAAVAKPAQRRSWWRWPTIRASYWAFAAAGVLLVSYVAAYWRVEEHRYSRPDLHPVVAAAAEPAAKTSANHDELLKRVAAMDKAIAALEQEARDQKQVIADLEARSTKFKDDDANTKSELAKANERSQELTAELEAANTALSTMKTDLASARSAKDQSDAALVAQQFKLSELSEQVKGERAAAERERQLTAAVQEVRGLMGARNLHLIDVSDVDSSGKSKKAFGRVFYTEGKSLIFYAFDLGAKGNATKVSFQAWGQWEGQDRIAKNLGVFNIDDNVQKRWVLKVDDPEKLKNVNALFVTVEPLGGVDRPTGKKLLYAYLGTQANHP